jgi:hypothetical protein
MWATHGLPGRASGPKQHPLYETVLSRYFTPAHKRGMIIRDGPHCVGPGCPNPAAWCDAHHVEYHSRGGPTNLTGDDTAWRPAGQPRPHANAA